MHLLPGAPICINCPSQLLVVPATSSESSKGWFVADPLHLQPKGASVIFAERQSLATKWSRTGMQFYNRQVFVSDAYITWER